MNFDLHCDATSLEKARSGAIWGSIWMDVNGSQFPEMNWNDMPIAFLGEMFNALAHVRQSIGQSRRVRFFDGPFWVDLTGRDGGEISISVNSNCASPDAVISVDELSHTMTRVGRTLMDACQARGWGDHADVQRLRTASDYRKGS